MGLTGFDVERGIAKETVLCLFDGFFLGEQPEFPVNVDQTSLRQVFERGDDTIPKLSGRRAFNLKFFHALDSKFNCGPLG